MKKFYVLKEAKSKILLTALPEQVLKELHTLKERILSTSEDASKDKEYLDSHPLIKDHQRYKKLVGSSTIKVLQTNFIRALAYLVDKDFLTTAFYKKVSSAINSDEFSLGAKTSNSFSLGGSNNLAELGFYEQIINIILEENNAL